MPAKTWLLPVPGEDPYRLSVAIADVHETKRAHSLVSVVHQQPDQDPFVSSAWRFGSIIDGTPTEALLTIV
ncbi:hypothetical protein ACSMXN_05455 [Jatrophihabitans sp. DSM 45814]